MKPNEFDELIRRKFDQGDFEYNAANWERLEDRMDRKATRRKILMWLPLAPIAYISSVAASLAMIITIPVLMQHKVNENEMPQLSAAARVHVTQLHTQPLITANTPNTLKIEKQEIKKEEKTQIHNNSIAQQATEEVVANNNAPIVNTWKNSDNDFTTKQKNARKNYPAFSSFDPEPSEDRSRIVKTAISITGGVQYGTMNGYTIGATGRRMISDRFYVEGDIAFINNNGTGNVGNNTSSGTGASVFSAASAKMAAPVNARMVSENDVPTKPSDQTGAPAASNTGKYDLYYAQVTPSVGYNVRRNLSVGVGADVQRLLQTDKPLNTSGSEAITTDKAIPNVDMGIVGKTEVALSKTIKAGVYYRQDMNNVINPGNKFIDRSYMQFNLKFSIFRK